MAGRLDRGRASVRRRSWDAAYAHLTAVDQEQHLEPSDLEQLAIAAYLVGRDTDCVHLWERGHQEYLSRGDVTHAARCAFWLSFCLISRGEPARAGGWLGRARRLLEDNKQDCVELGYLLLPAALQRVGELDWDAAYATFSEAVTIGDRFGDVDLVTFARHGQGRTLLQMGKASEGVALLDEVMTAVMSGEVSPVVAGTVYCSVIGACREIFDLRRVREWTAALTHWCASQPGLVLYHGECMIYRAEIMQLQGAWADALREAVLAGERLREPAGQPEAGLAFYQQGELHRLAGEFDTAEAAYREASRLGWEPQPGLALLRLVQGRVDAADAAIRRALDEATGIARAKLLPAYVEVMLATGDLPAARAGVTELAAVAKTLCSPFLRAAAAQAAGAVLLAEGDPRAALGELRHAWREWQALTAPYEGARTRVLTGLACRALGDEDTAEMELDAARWVFEQLGASPDLARVEMLSRASAALPASGLTAREVGVLRLVAAGKSNRAIAADLVLSEKTVARHISNIFAKLGLSSRAAATAYAYEHDLR